MPIIGTVNPTAEILYGGAKIVLRGLSAKDIGELSKKHFSSMAKMFERAQELAADESKDADETDAALAGLLQEAIVEVPDLVTDVIALAADEPEARDDISGWPAVLQLRCVQEIVGLTFVSYADLEKLMGALAKILPAASPEIPGQEGSSGGYGRSGETSRTSEGKDT